MASDGASVKMGPWDLVGEIASGGMGTVHLARGRGPHRERIAAVKTLHPHLENDIGFVRMFMDEARLARHIVSRHVVETYELLEDSGRHAIAMRYVEGGSLAALLQACSQRLDPAISLRIVHDTLLGLEAAHEAKTVSGERLDIVHRDVSPQNVLVGMDGYTQLSDFGVARARGRLQSTQGQQIKGKLRYLAPEQLRASGVDRRVDIFSAGIVLWELLVGAQLFAAEDDAEVMRRVMFMPVGPPSSHGAQVPLAVDRVCLHALSRDRDRRYASAREFADAILATGMVAPREAVAEVVRDAFGENTRRRRHTLLMAAKRQRRNRVRTASIGIALSVVLGATAWVSLRPHVAHSTAAEPIRDMPSIAMSESPAPSPPPSSPSVSMPTSAPMTVKPASTPAAKPGGSARVHEPARAPHNVAPPANSSRKAYIPDSL